MRKFHLIPFISLTIILLSSFYFGVWALRPEDRDNIMEAVFRYQFDHNASAQQQEAYAYFLALEDGSDPSEMFMSRFALHKPPVKKVSHSKVVSIEMGYSVVDVVTGKEGLIFRIDSIGRGIHGDVFVNGGYYEGGLTRIIHE